MNSTAILRQLASYLLLLYALMTKVALCEDVDKPVADVKGHSVVAGAEYKMMLPYQPPDGGEYAPGKTSNMTCPLSVVLDQASHGELVRISPTTGKNGVIFENEPVEVSFERKIECAESSKWMIVKQRGEDFWSLGLGSAEKDHPGSEILNGSFKIQKTNEFFGYKFMFCPNATTCGNITGYNRLILAFGGDSPSSFVLVPKA